MQEDGRPKFNLSKVCVNSFKSGNLLQDNTISCFIISYLDMKLVEHTTTQS